MQAVLVMFKNDGERRSFSISRELTVIGRRQDCDLMIPLGEISRKHCRIVREGDTLRLEDLGSSNGTFYNGRRVQESVLAAGDTIQVGPVSFVLQIDGVPADDEIKPHSAAPAHAATDDGEEELQTLSDDDDQERTPATNLDISDDQLQGLDDENLEILDPEDSTAGSVTLDDKKPKGRK